MLLHVFEVTFGTLDFFLKISPKFFGGFGASKKFDVVFPKSNVILNGLDAATDVEGERTDIRIGDTVYVEKAGEIIPQVVGVILAKRPKDAKNFIRTIPGKGWNAIFRLYGPLDPWFDKTWRLDDIRRVK